MNNINSVNIYKNFLKRLRKEIITNDFKKALQENQKIDLKYFTKKINIDQLQNFIIEYEDKDIKENNFKKFQVLLPGNPEIVFKICLEAIRYGVDMEICIEDFCLAQNTILICAINEVLRELKIKNIITLKNLVKDKEIILNSRNVDRTICIGNSNLYNRILDKIENFIFYPYGIFEIYSDSEEFEELQKTIYDYLVENQYECEIYYDIEYDDPIDIINKESYKFCILLLSKDKEKMNLFKNNIDSQYVILNKNPFTEIKFNLEIL